MSKLPYILISTLFAIIFLFISTLKLDAQGLYYDELNFAPPALTFKGINADYSIFSSIKGLPIFINSYQGAVMSYPYGLYLKYFNQNFSVISWRLWGILIWTVSIFIFSLLSAKFLKPYQLAIFLAFLLTDNSVTLAIRFNYGPVLIPLISTLIIILAATKIFKGEQLRFYELFVLGFSIGLGIYAKLSSLPLLLPLVLLMIFMFINKRIKNKTILMILSGLITGALPVIYFNIKSLILDHNFFSLISTEVNHSFGRQDFINKTYSFFVSATGNGISSHILGTAYPVFHEFQEIFFIFFFSIFLIVSAVTFYKKIELLPIFSYESFLLIFLIMYLFPMNTSVRHTIIAVPFLYLALATFWEILDKNISEGKKYLKRSFSLLIIIWLIMRLFNTYQLTQNLYQGKYSLSWHPEYTKIAQFAGTKIKDSIFVTADWGFTHQLFLFTGVKENTIYEPFWDYTDKNQFFNSIKGSGKQFLYLIYHKYKTPIKPEVTRKIINDINKANFLEKRQIEDEISKFEVIEVKKFRIVENKSQ